MFLANFKNNQALAKALLFFSGISALVYQAIWVRQLTLVVGVDVFAITTGVSAFFAGLALGSVVFGRLADRVANPLRIYVALEIGIAVLGIAATVLLSAAPHAFVSLQSSVGVFAWLLPFLLVAIPAALMGGTLPPLLATVRPKAESTGLLSGKLYAANTAGAIVGTLLAVFAVIPMFGIQGSARFAAALNVVLAATAFLAVRTTTTPPSIIKTTDVPFTARSQTAFIALTVYAVAGGIALGYEVVWTQVIVQFLSTRAVAFGVVLATYLSGLVIGSWLYSRRSDRVHAPWTAFGLLISGAGLAALASFAVIGPWLPALQENVGSGVFELTSNRMLEMIARFATVACIVVLPATLLLGAAFPAAARLIVQPQRAGGDVGLTLAVNTACGIIGTLLTGFVLIPLVGLANSLGVLAVGAMMIGAFAMSREKGQQSIPLRWGAVLVLITAGLAVMLPRDNLATLLAFERGGDLVFYDEGPGGTVAVIEQQTSKGTFSRLYIQGVSNSGDVMPSKRYMRLQALLPLVIHSGEPESAMVIAFGTGITAGSLLAFPDLERRIVVELLQPVVDASPLFDGNFSAASDGRVEIVIADGRHELMRRDEMFDLITLEPPPPAAAGVVNLYSREFYELAGSRLNEHGLLAQWLPINTQNEEDTQSLMRSMLDSFPYVTLWTTEVHEMMLIGSMQTMSFDYNTIVSRMSAPATAAAFREVGIGSTNDLLATYITDRAGLEDYVSDAMPVTDDRPRIEYASWIRPGEITRVLPRLLALRRPLSIDAPDQDRLKIEASFTELAEFYDISVAAYSGDRDAWQQKVQHFNRNRSPNAYYDWFFAPTP